MEILEVNVIISLTLKEAKYNEEKDNISEVYVIAQEKVEESEIGKKLLKEGLEVMDITENDIDDETVQVIVSFQ
jgi:hypothetical protein